MRFRHYVAFAVFCLLAGSRWLVDLAWPQTTPPLLGLGLHYTAAGLVAFILSVWQGDVGDSRQLRVWPLAVASLLLLSVPILLQQFVTAVRPETSVVLYAMVPLCVVGIVATRDETLRAMMMSTLAGLAGLLLLLPWRLPSTYAQTIFFGIVLVGVLLTAGGSVWMPSLLRGTSLMKSVMVAALGNAVLIGLAGLLRGEHLQRVSRADFVAMLVDVPQVFLLFWLLCRLAPEQFAARFFLVPLVALIEGATVLRPSFDVRMVAGIFLLLFGAGAMLFGKRESVLSLSIRQ